jgi:hypothetical protein
LAPVTFKSSEMQTFRSRSASIFHEGIQPSVAAIGADGWRYVAIAIAIHFTLVKAITA